MATHGTHLTYCSRLQLLLCFLLNIKWQLEFIYTLSMPVSVSVFVYNSDSWRTPYQLLLPHLIAVIRILWVFMLLLHTVAEDPPHFRSLYRQCDMVKTAQHTITNDTRYMED